MSQFVSGFYFDASLEYVALIRKDHPPYLAGKLNGVGGKIEQCESPIQAMIREFKEEAGQHVETWKRFCVLQGKNCYGEEFVVHFFYAVGDFCSIRSMTQEKVERIKISEIDNHEPQPNIKWLIPMAINTQYHLDACEEFVVNETEQRKYY